MKVTSGSGVVESQTDQTNADLTGRIGLIANPKIAGSVCSKTAIHSPPLRAVLLVFPPFGKRGQNLRDLDQNKSGLSSLLFLINQRG